MPGLEVTYVDGEPVEIEHFSMMNGMMKFTVEGETAVQDPEWDRLNDKGWKDGYSRKTTTGDIIRSVLELPFIEEVNHGDVDG